MLDFQLLGNRVRVPQENQRNVQLPHDGDNTEFLYSRCSSVCKKNIELPRETMPKELEKLWSPSGLVHEICISM